MLTIFKTLLTGKLPSFKTILYILLVVGIGLGIYGAYSHYTGLVKQNEEYRELIVSMKKDIDELKRINAENIEAVKQVTASCQVDRATIGEHAKNESAITKDTDKRIEERKKKEQEAKTKPAVKKLIVDKVGAPGQVMVDAQPIPIEETLSEIRIDSLWEAFCSSNKDHAQCRKPS